MRRLAACCQVKQRNAAAATAAAAALVAAAVAASDEGSRGKSAHGKNVSHGPKLAPSQTTTTATTTLAAAAAAATGAAAAAAAAQIKERMGKHPRPQGDVSHGPSKLKECTGEQRRTRPKGDVLL